MPSFDDPRQRIALRAALAARQGGRCHYCGRMFRRRPSRTATLDHVVPRCRGGAGDATNLVACCAACNAAKGPLLEAELAAVSPFDAF